MVVLKQVEISADYLGSESQEGGWECFWITAVLILYGIDFLNSNVIVQSLNSKIKVGHRSSHNGESVHETLCTFISFKS